MSYCVEVTFPMTKEFSDHSTLVEAVLGMCDGAGSDFVTRDMAWTVDDEDEAQELVSKAEALANEVPGISATYYPL